MVIDTINNFDKYLSLNPLFKEVLTFLKETDLNTLDLGKHIIIEDKLFVNIENVKAKKLDEAVLETHEKMIDIQIPLSSNETFGYTPKCNLPQSEYNSTKDISKIPGLKAQNYVTCAVGMMVIFFPEEGHAPCISDNGNEIRKAIFKVKA